MKTFTNFSAMRQVLTLLIAFFATANTIWAQQEHLVTLNANSGTVTPSTIVCKQGEPIGDLPTPTRKNFTFAGWFTIPGHPETRVTNETIYDYNTHGEMLHARWTNKTITITFMNYDGSATIGTVQVSGDGGSLVDIPANKFKLAVTDGEFFAGYYTRINGEGDRIYSGVEDNGELHPVSAAVFTENTTLYAFHTHVKHTTHWDYSYINSVEQTTPTWTNINYEDNTTRIKYGKLTFMDNTGNVLKWIYFQAANVGNKTTTGMSADLSTHTTTKGQFHLQLASESAQPTPDGTVVIGTMSEDGNAGTWNVYFTDEQLSHFTRYNFEPISNTGYVSAQNWIRTTDPVAHDTWFTFNGASEGNTADLHWTVKLTNLKVYPDYVIAKPLFYDGSNWEEISQLLNVDGVTCQKATEASDGSYATYTGSYPVWKVGSTSGYGYSIGMVGFEVNGQKVYMNASKPGHFDPAYNSADTQVSGDNGKSEWNSGTQTFPDIIYTIQAPNIQVIRFLPGSAPGAKLDGATPEILWGEKDQSISDFSTKYFATCPGCTFLGWSETDGATAPTYTTSYTFDGAKTLYPVWQDDVAPVITPEKEKSCINPVNVTITDNLKVASVTVKIGDAVQSIDVTGLGTTTATLTLPAPADAAEIVSFVYTIDAVDAAGNTAIQKTVTIFNKHDWTDWKPAKDPTATEDGCTTEFRKCKNCGEYETQTGGKIIPAASVLVKDADGDINSVTSTRDWDDEVNRAVAKVKEGQTYLMMTGDAEVAGSAIAKPLVPAILDLNGQSLFVDHGEGPTYDAITGNHDVTILLKDDGVTEYTNQCRVIGSIASAENSTIDSPIKYVRDYFAGYTTRAGKWQALYLPFAAGSVTAPDGVTYTFGTPLSVEITDKEAKLSINKMDNPVLEANTHYFVKSSTGKLAIDITGVDLLPYEAPTEHEITVSENYTFRSSLTNKDNEAELEKMSYWVLTNGGAFSWAKKGSHQRPYHWVIYETTPALTSAGTNARLMSIIEYDADPTAIESIEEEDLQGGEIYSISGHRMPANASLPSGLYIRNGKKFYVK